MDYSDISSIQIEELKVTVIFNKSPDEVIYCKNQADSMKKATEINGEWLKATHGI